MNTAMPELFAHLSTRMACELALLPDKPEETPDNTLRALWLAASGHPASALQAAQLPLPRLDPADEEKLHALVARRLDGVPLAHITGRQSFLDMEFLAGPDALVPRRETELLARAAIDSIAGREALVVDACTGCGNLALAIATHVPRARVFGADLSDSAVAMARRNARHFGLDERVAFRTGDLLAPFETAEFLGKVDLLTCNPPYISSAKVAQMAPEIAGHEPSLAFDGGPLGVAVLVRLLREAPRFVRAGGWLAFEVGLGQGRGIARRLQATGHWQEVRSLADATGAIRAVLAQRNRGTMGVAT
jgi:release factor glutamine methyltransferase